MRIIKTTDGRHVGKDIPVLNTGDSIDLDGFVFEVLVKKQSESGQVLLSNPNYQLVCEE